MPNHVFVSLLVLCFIGSCSTEWSEVIADLLPSSPSPRYYFAATTNTSGGYLYIFGGVIVQNGVTSVVNDMWRISLNTIPLTWEKVATNPPPPARGYHASAVASNGNWLIFGGKTEGNTVEFYNDLWSFDFSTNTWTQLIPNGAPRSPRRRFWSSLVAYEQEVVLFGGYGIDPLYPGYGPMNDLWIYNTSNGWFEIFKNNTPGSPPARQGHAASIDSKDGMIIFGGQPLLGGMEDIWRFDFNFGRWIPWLPSIVPEPRSGQAAAIAKDRFYTFGGSFTRNGDPETYHNDLWYFDLSSGLWVDVQDDSNAPSNNQPWKRKAPSLVSHPDGNSLFLFGGYGLFQGLKSDMWQFIISNDTN